MARSSNALLFGRRPVQTFVSMITEGAGQNAAEGVAKIWLSESFPGKFKADLLKALPAAPLQEVPRRQLDQRFPGIHHQGVVLEFRPGYDPARASTGDTDWRDLVREHPGLVVLLDRIQDPHNLGSIIRSAEALGAALVIRTGQGAPLGDVAHRVSSGASLRLPVFEHRNLRQVVQELKSAGYWICSAAGEAQPESRALVHDHTDLSGLPPTNDIALVIGNEGEGVKALTLSESDYVISIAMRGSTPSLNAGVAAALLIDRLVSRF